MGSVTSIISGRKKTANDSYNAAFRDENAPGGCSAAEQVNRDEAPNNGMHPTRDTTAVMYFQSLGRASDGGR
jgi:hypothetical protein